MIIFWYKCMDLNLINLSQRYSSGAGGKSWPRTKCKVCKLMISDKWFLSLVKWCSLEVLRQGACNVPTFMEKFAKLYFDYYVVHTFLWLAWLLQSVACLGLLSGAGDFNSRVQHILSLVVSYWWKDEHWVLINRLGSACQGEVWLGLLTQWLSWHDLSCYRGR